MSTQVAYRYSHTVGYYQQIKARGFNSPVDLALGRDGLLYVLNRALYDMDANLPYSKRITMCTVDEEYLGEFGGGGTGDGEMMWPASITIDKDDKIYVSDEALQRISIYSKEGEFLSKWGVNGTGDGEFDRPAGIAFDRDDHLLVVDGLNNRIQKYNKRGGFLGGWGKGGSGDGEFNMPWGIAVDRAGDVYVADWRNDRIQKFNAEGKHMATWGSPGQGDGEFHRPAGVAVDREGIIYVADWGNERVQVLGPDGGFLSSFKGESGLSKWAESYFVSNMDELEERQKADMDPGVDRLAAGTPHDYAASTEKLFWGPTAVKVDDKGRVYVADSCRHRIQVYLKES